MEITDNVRKELNNLPYLLKNELDRKLSEKEEEYYDRPHLSPYAIY